LRNWPILDGSQTLAVALALFAGVYVLQAEDTNPADALEILYVVPIALLAVRFGLRGGLAGAFVGVALIGTYEYAAHEFDATLLGSLCWAITFLLLGALLGRFVDNRRRLEAELSRYYDASIDLLATADRRGRFTHFNAAWERVLGYPPEAMRLRRYIEFVHPDDREATVAEVIALSAGSHETIGFRNRFRAVDGSYRWLQWNVTLSLSDGAIDAVGRDITVQREAEQQLASNAEVLETKVDERTRELDEARADTLQRLAVAAEYRDDDTFQHTERVGISSAEIAYRLGLSAEQIELLREAAPLHDVGKLAIPDRILLKPGKLSPQEYEVMKTHAGLGARLLSGSGSPVLQMAAVIAESHHERWDGTGYPNGRAREAIPLVGRVVAVADVFDALTHDRPYKSAWSVEQAIEEIQRGAGSQFDPCVAAAFLATQQDARVAAETRKPRESPRANDTPRHGRPAREHHAGVPA
jgi:PAS domain S-box-containing protein